VAEDAEDEGMLGPTVASPLLTVADLIRRSARSYYTRELGLSYLDWRVLLHVGELGPLSLGNLADAMHHDLGQISRGVTRLAQAGFLVRERKGGVPGTKVRLTDQGQVIFDELVHRATQRQAALIEGIDPAEVEQFRRTLKLIEANARRIAASENDPGDSGT